MCLITKNTVAKVYDVLGWFAAAIVSMKILFLQRFGRNELSGMIRFQKLSNNVGSNGGLNSRLLPTNACPVVTFQTMPALHLYKFTASEDANVGVDFC